MDEQQVAERLAQEIVAVADGGPPLTFALAPFDAYALVAALQFTSRNPQLSGDQRRIVLRFAHQLADALAEAARRVVGSDSAIETTLRQGFDPRFDVPSGGARG